MRRMRNDAMENFILKFQWVYVSLLRIFIYQISILCTETRLCFDSVTFDGMKFVGMSVSSVASFKI